MSRRFSSPMLRTVGIALAISAAVACEPSRAAAECGDYVSIVNQPSETSPERPVSPAPCHGPNCSSKPTAPTLPLSAPVTEAPSSKDLAGRALSDCELGSDSGSCFAPPESGSPIHKSNAIFHPPRAV